MAESVDLRGGGMVGGWRGVSAGSGFWEGRKSVADSGGGGWRVVREGRGCWPKSLGG